MGLGGRCIGDALGEGMGTRAHVDRGSGAI